MSDHVTRPTEDAPPAAWTQADLDLAAQRGEHDRIVEARRSGALDQLLSQPNARNRRKSAPFTPAPGK